MCLICERIDLIKEDRNLYLVAELETGYVVIGDVQHFYGYTLFLFKEHATELNQLEKSVRDRFLGEMADVAETVKQVFGAEKMNLELLGNGDAHLHWHLFPRRAGDLGEHGVNGKGPVWWLPFEEMYSDEHKPSATQLQEMVEQLAQALKK